jgi:hypothetical protein
MNILTAGLSSLRRVEAGSGVGEQQWEDDDGAPIIELARHEGFEVRL